MASQPTVDTIELGEPGLNHSAGRIYEEQHPKLRGGSQAMQVYEEMSLNDATVGAGLNSIEGFLRRVQWQVCPATKGDAKAEKWSAFVSTCLEDLDRPWSDVTDDAFKMLTYGFSLHEVVYKYRRGPDSKSKRFQSRYTDGLIGWRDIATRSQTSIEKWDISDNGTIQGCWQIAPSSANRVYLPMARCALFRTSAYKNNPEGLSLLRRAHRPWYFKKRLEEVEAIGLTRSLVNLPKMEIPARFMASGATAAEKAVRAQFERLVSLISKDQLSGIVIPSELDTDNKPTGYKFSLLNATSSQLSTDPVIRRYDSRILMALSAEILLVGTEKQGSFALSVTKNENFVRSLDKFADIIEDQFNSVLIPRLMQVNGVPPQYWPYLEHKPIDKVGAAELGLFLSQAAAHITPTVETENALREVAQLPEISDAEYEAAVEERKATEAAKAAPGPSQTDPPTQT